MSTYALELLADAESLRDHLHRAWDSYKPLGFSHVSRSNGRKWPNFASWEYVTETVVEASSSPWDVDLDYGQVRIVGNVCRPAEAKESSALVELSVRGTDNAGNWITNFTAELVDTQVGCRQGRVHRGFQDAYNMLRGPVLTFIIDELSSLAPASVASQLTGMDGLDPEAKLKMVLQHLVPVAAPFVRVHGHSLGGALGTLVAYDLASCFGLPVECHTWASPRIGDRAFAESYAEHVPRTARFLNKFDPVPRIPSNPWDPFDDDQQGSDFIYAILGETQKRTNTEGYCHVAPGFLLDPDANMSAFLLVGGFEALAAAAGCQSAVGLKFLLQPHDLARYEVNMESAFQRSKPGRQLPWWRGRPSVGTWLQPRLEVHDESLLGYGQQLLATLGECGPRLQLALTGDGRARADLLRQAGVTVDPDGHASLHQVLAQGSSLRELGGGDSLLEDAQAAMLRALPLLAATMKRSGLDSDNSVLRSELEHSQAGQDLVAWGMQQLDAVERDPQILKAWFQPASLQGSAETSMTLDLTAVDGQALLTSIKGQCWNVLTRPGNLARLEAMGVDVDDQGNVRLDRVLDKAQELLQTDDGAQLLHAAQTCALDLLSMIEVRGDTEEPSQGSEVYIRKLEQTTHGRELLAWARLQTAALRHNPEAFRAYVASFDTSCLKDWGVWGAQLVSDPSSRTAFGSRLLAILQSQEAHEQLKAVGVQFDSEGRVELDQVLAKGKDLMETPDGTALLRSVQEQVLKLLSTLEEEASGLEKSEELEALLHLEATQEGHKLLSWGRDQLTTLRNDPEALKGLLGSLDVQSLEAWGTFAKQFFMKAMQPWELLRSEEARKHLEAAGVDVDADGNVQLQQVLEQGQKLLDTEEGARVLRKAQMQALNLISALEDEASDGETAATSRRYLHQLQSTEQGRHFLEWGREHLRAAKEDPEVFRRWLATMDLSRFGDLQEWGQVLLSGDTEAQQDLLANLRGQCLDLIQSEEAQRHLHMVGVKIEANGDVKLGELVKKGRELIDSDEGALVLRQAQAKAVNMVPLLQEKAAEYGVTQEQFQQYLRQTEQGKALLAWGEESFAAGADDPEALKKWLGNLNMSQVGEVVIPSDPLQREKLFNEIKDQGLKFILDHVALLKVPPIVGVHEGKEYTLDNIDLTSFTLQACDVEVEVLETKLAGVLPQSEAALDAVGADDTAPEPSAGDAGGHVDADGEGGLASLESFLHSGEQSEPIEDRVSTVAEATSLTLPSPGTITAQTATEEVASVAVDDCSQSTGLIGKSGEVLRLTANNMSLDIPTIKWTYSQQHFPYLHGEGHARARVSDAVVSIAFRVERVRDAEGNQWPQLALATFSVDIKDLFLEVTGSYFSWAYNLLVTYFQDELRRSLAEGLTHRILSNVSLLLAPLNEYIRPSAAVLLSALGVKLEHLPWAHDLEIMVEPAEDGEILSGFEVDSDTFALKAVQEDGSLAKWNQANPSFAVRVGDKIVEVNGIKSPREQLYSAIVEGDARTLKFLRQYDDADPTEAEA